MFREFMEEVADIERAGVFSQPRHTVNEEVTEGEKVVGCIADQPYLMALCIAVENRAEAYKDKISRITTEDETLRIRTEFGSIFDVIWTEIRLHFGVFSGAVGLRKGWTVVTRVIKDERRMPEARVFELAIPPDLAGALNAIFSAIGDGCNDPNCSVHSSGIGRRKPMAEA